MPCMSGYNTEGNKLLEWPHGGQVQVQVLLLLLLLLHACSDMQRLIECVGAGCRFGQWTGGAGILVDSLSQLTLSLSLSQLVWRERARPGDLKIE